MHMHVIYLRSNHPPARFKMDCFVFSLLFQISNPNTSVRRDTKPRLTPSAIASFLELVRPKSMQSNLKLGAKARTYTLRINV